MVGGTEADLASARDVFDVLAKRVFHVGEQGAGATMKLAVNAVVHATNHALAEALVLAEKAGLTAPLRTRSSPAAPSPRRSSSTSARRSSAQATHRSCFSVDLVAKDYALILALAERVGAVMDQATTGRATAAAAIEAGLGQHDMSALAELLRAGSAASAG